MPNSERTTTKKSNAELRILKRKKMRLGWCRKAVLRCQCCGEQFKNYTDAAACIASHDRLRCYLCFKVFKTNGRMLQHFERKHRHPVGGRRNCITCPHCERSVPYKSVNCHVITEHILPRALRPPPKEKLEPEPDIELETDEQPQIITDLESLNRESKRCQVCKKEFPNAASASVCLVSHNRLRCYFCLGGVFKSTEKLFQHFASSHNKAEKENCLLCQFCEKSIPYKSVSCHIINTHLRLSEEESNSDNKIMAFAPEIDMESYLSEVKRCQVCNKECDITLDAAHCLAGHNRVRCYMCLDVFSNTSDMFEHFAKSHKPGAKENCTSCPFCEQSVAYRSITCHIITKHLCR